MNSKPLSINWSSQYLVVVTKRVLYPLFSSSTAILGQNFSSYSLLSSGIKKSISFIKSSPFELFH